MKRHKILGIFILFVIQMGFLLYEQRAYSETSLQFMDSEIKMLTDEGLPRNQALAIVSAISSAKGHATSALGNGIFISAFTSFTMIIIIATNRPEEKSQT